MLQSKRLYAKFLKYEFWLDKMMFFKTYGVRKGTSIDPTMIEAIMN